VGLELLVLSSLVFQLCSVLGVQSCDRLYECACFLYSLSMRYSCISSCIFFRFLFSISPKPKVPKCSQYLTCKSGVHYLLLARASLSSLFFSLSPGASFILIYFGLQLVFSLCPFNASPYSLARLTMGQPSTQASNAIVYLTYGAFLCVDLVSPSCPRVL
jgi:hypothetical protein